MHLKISVCSLSWGSVFSAVAALNGFAATPTLSQIRPDATLREQSRVVPEGDQIRIDGGTVAQSNLFHSFQDFSIPENLEVHFNNGPSIERIITRVTGANPSHLDGQLSANGTADLILINPRGIEFGETARLSLGGAFLATTAEQVQFADGTVWGANPARDAPLLTLSAPVGVQFGERPGAIINRSLSVDDRGAVRGLQASQLSLFGGLVQFDGGQARSPHLELASFGPGTLVNLDRQGRVTDVAATSWGAIELTQGAFLEGGEIRLLGDRLEMTDGAQLVAVDEGAIAIEMQNAVSLEGGAVMLSDNGADIQVQTQRFSLTDDAAIITQVNDRSQGGAIAIDATDGITLVGGGFAQFNQYLTTITSGNVQPSDVITGIVAMTTSGRGGDIRLETQGDLRMTEGSMIGQVSFGSALGGNFDLEVGGQIDVNESGIVNTTTVGSQSSAGEMRVTTENLRLGNGGVLVTATLGNGNSGNITLHVNETLEIVNSLDDTLIPTGIFNNSLFGIGTAGDIQINTGRLIGQDGGTISTNSGALLFEIPVTEGGPGGDIRIEAREFIELVRLTGNSRLGSGITAGTFSRLPAGDVTLITPRLQLQGAAGVSTETFGPADAGTLTVIAQEIQLFELSPMGFQSQLNSTSGRMDFGLETTGNGGDIRLLTDRLILREQALINVRSYGAGGAGVLEIIAREIVLDGGSRLNAETVSGPGGNIQVRSQTLQLRNGSSINTDAGSTDGGNIRLDTATLAALENSDITANALDGRGGRVQITAEGIFGIEFRESLTDQSDITASSRLGPEFSGEVSINTTDVNLSSALVSLPQPMSNPVIHSPCSTGDNRFVVTGRRGLPQAPWQTATRQVLWEDWQGFSDLPSQRTDTPRFESRPVLVEAESLRWDEWGNPVLVGDRPFTLNTPVMQPQESEDWTR